MYDFKYCKNIKKNYDVDPYFTIEMLEQYFLEYPKDLYAYSMYINLLINVGYFDKALKVFENVWANLQYGKDEYKKESIKRSLIFYKIRILMYSKKYQEAYDLLNDNYELLKEDNYFTLYSIISFCRKKLGKNIKDEYDDYHLKQICDYSEKRFLEHINKHKMQNDDDIIFNDIKNSKFYSDFPIEKVIYELKKFIPGNKRMYKGFFDYIYYFRYNSCGKNGGIETDYFEVITYGNSNDYITMYPVLGVEKLPINDINYLKEDKTNSLKKRLTQIEKFNRKYNK